MFEKETIGQSIWNLVVQTNELRKRDAEELKRQTTEAVKTLQNLRIQDQKPQKTEEDHEEA